MDDRGVIASGRFWLLALLWLPAGVMAAAALRRPLEEGLAAVTGIGPTTALTAAGSLVLIAPCGLPLALACRRLWRLGYRRGAWWAGIALGAVTVAAALTAGLLGPVAVAAYAVVLSLPVWIAWRWLVRRG